MDALIVVTWILVIVLGGGGLVLAGSSGRRDTERLRRRLQVMERKLDAVLEQLGVEPPGPDLGRVRELLSRGKYVPAVKAYRDATGADLREAAQAVDRLRGQRTGDQV